MERELALEMVRVTELAALASAKWMGRGSKTEADGAATAAMRHMFNSVSIQGTVVIGEGEMDEAPMLYIGEKVGNGQGPEVDVAVDPLEGTELAAKGLSGAIAVMAVAPKGNFLHAPDMYMEKLAVGPALKGMVTLEDPLDVTIRKASQILNRPVSDLTVSILERDRHARQTGILRDLGVRIKLLPGGDVAGAMAPAFLESGIDLYVGSGGAPEGVLAAAALRCLGGDFQGRLMPADLMEYDRCVRMGIRDPHRVLSMEELVGTGDVIFAATGITPGEFMKGVRILPGNRAETSSIVMRAKTGTIRIVQANHYLPGKPFLQTLEGLFDGAESADAAV
ncbi:class II fructose-bisphosphatase [Gorillibacterium sp. sgz5001074]|uniref:class II fructose-bisphosphatase n=1 Tax=Gorillibacterium sp. sgz5001074 TaxID=3446695 RepID=UPI003F66318B